MAHEIGHVILHMNISDSFIDDNATISGRSTDEKEQEANYFAACLLMPVDDVEKFLDLELADILILRYLIGNTGAAVMNTEFITAKVTFLEMRLNEDGYMGDCRISRDGSGRPYDFKRNTRIL